MKRSWITADEVAARLNANVKPSSGQLAIPPWAELIMATSSALWSFRNVFALNASPTRDLNGGSTEPDAHESTRKRTYACICLVPTVRSVV